eukprot:s454_g11.t2
MLKAFGKAGDFIDALSSGAKWFDLYKAKVCQTVLVGTTHSECSVVRIICIEGGLHCDEEYRAIPDLKKAVKDDMMTQNGRRVEVVCEWMSMGLFLKEHSVISQSVCDDDDARVLVRCGALYLICVSCKFYRALCHLICSDSPAKDRKGRGCCVLPKMCSEQNVSSWCCFCGDSRCAILCAQPGVPQVLYLATDEVQTAEAFRKALPPGSQIQLCCREEVKRSRGGVRPDGIDNEVHRSPCEALDAEDALLDALCLSQCTDLVCIDSNLSIFVCMLNPKIRVHPMSHPVPPGWEEKASYPTEPVFSSYRVVWSPGIFVSALPSTASEIVGQATYDQVVYTTGRYWEGWVELTTGGWARVQGGKSGCWAMERFDGYISMLRISRGELMIPEGPRLPRKRRPEEPLPGACCQAQTSSYSASTWLQIGRAEWAAKRRVRCR